MNIGTVTVDLRDPSNLSKFIIVKKVKENPRREGTHGWQSFEKIEDGMTYKEAIKAGARNRDIRWDLENGNLSLRRQASPSTKRSRSRRPRKSSTREKA